MTEQSLARPRQQGASGDGTDFLAQALQTAFSARGPIREWIQAPGKPSRLPRRRASPRQPGSMH